MRTADGFLTEHDLRSGLNEQYAIEIDGKAVVVELRWIKHLNSFEVSTKIDRHIARCALYASLLEAQARFTRAAQQAQSGRVRRKAS